MTGRAGEEKTYRVKNWEKFQHFRDRRPPWIKLYTALLDDPEWHELEPLAAKVLVMLWLIASANPGGLGVLPSPKVLSFRLRLPVGKVSSILSRLSHWIVPVDIALISRRYQSDSTETETETYKSETEKALVLPGVGEGPPPPVDKSDEPKFTPEDMARIWNDAVDFFSIEKKVLVPKVTKVTAERRKKALSRIRDCHLTEKKWRKVMDIIHHSPFLSGERPGKGHGQWRADFDFALKSEATLTKILEGGYS